MNFISMSIEGDDLIEALQDYPDGIMILILQAQETGDIQPKGFVYDRNGARRFVRLDLEPEDSSIPVLDYPVFLTTLRWKYSEDVDVNFEFNPHIKHYLHGLVNNKRVVYYFSESSFAELLNKVQDGLTIEEFNDMKPFKKKKDILDAIQILLAASGGGSFNPVPPKLVP